MSGFALGDYFEPLTHRLSSALIDDASLLDVRRFADCIPGEVTAFFGFECPVSDNSGSADLLFCSTQSERHSEILAGHHRSIHLPPGLLELPAWRHVQDFCIDWESAGSDLYQRLLNIWLEFDIGQSQPPYAPSIFFGTSRESHSQPEVVARLVAAALHKLVPAALENGRGEALQRVLTCVSANGGHVFQVGAMLSRNLPAIRVCFRGVEPARIVSTLQQCGWPGNPEELDCLIAIYRQSCERIDVDIDVGEFIGDKIGLECYFGRDQNTLTRLKAFLQIMIVHGLISETTADALVDFNGLEHQDTNPELWCDHLQRLAVLEGRDIINLLACWVHHVKLIYQDNCPLSAKAYLAVQADRMRRSDLRGRLSALRTS